MTATRALRWAGGALGAVLVLRACGGEPVRIASGSMEATLLVGDHVLAEKVTFGARLGLPGGRAWRAPGLRPPRRGDVVVFDPPGGDGPLLVKRIVGMPGDTVEVRAGRFFRNGTAVPAPPEAVRAYRAEGAVTAAAVRAAGAVAAARVEGAGAVVFEASTEVAAQVARLPGVARVAPAAASGHGPPGWAAFPEGAGNGPARTAPLVVPGRGDPLVLSAATWPRDRTLLTEGEGLRARLGRGGVVEVDGRPVEAVVLTQDYYFVLGDHRDASEDSRAFGFVPARRLVGRAAFVLGSWDEAAGRARWRRFFRPVR